MLLHAPSFELLDEETINMLNALDHQKRLHAIQYLQDLAPQDLWGLGGDEIRNSVYKKYITDIADLIAKIEVYGHSLPIYVWGLIEHLWQLLATASVEVDNVRKKLLYEALQKYTVFVENELRYLLAGYYISSIKRYRKTFRHFEHQRVSDECNIPILKQINYYIADVKANRKRGNQIRKKYYPSHKGRELDVVNCIAVADIQCISELQEAVDISEQAIDFCEQHFAEIVNCKFKPSFFKRICTIILDAISFAFIVCGAVQIIQLFQ